jgi:DNA-binding CsgD family transcriptional regulator
VLSDRDYQSLSDFVLRLYAQQDVDCFPAWLARELTRLVGAVRVTWNEIDLSAARAHVNAWPALPVPARVNRLLEDHLHEHPAIRAWRDTGLPGVRAISDFVSPREYQYSGIYQQLYRELGYQDQLGLALTPPQGRALTLALGRSRFGVTPHDRALLAWVAPHILQAYRNLQALAAARRAVATPTGAAVPQQQVLIELGDDGRPLELPAAARSLLRQVFSDTPRTGLGLPAEVLAWLRSRADPSAAGDGRWRRGRRQLRLRYFADAVRPGSLAGLLMLDQEDVSARAGGPYGSALSRREREVVAELAVGLSNAQIAERLHISPGTVKVHLEHIYAKLGVSNRTAAARSVATASP